MWKSIESSTYSDFLNMLDKFAVEEGLADNKDVKYIVSALHELEEFFSGNEKDVFTQYIDFNTVNADVRRVAELLYIAQLRQASYNMKRFDFFILANELQNIYVDYLSDVMHELRKICGIRFIFTSNRIEEPYKSWDLIYLPKKPFIKCQGKKQFLMYLVVKDKLLQIEFKRFKGIWSRNLKKILFKEEEKKFGMVKREVSTRDIEVEMREKWCRDAMENAEKMLEKYKEVRDKVCIERALEYLIEARSALEYLTYIVKDKNRRPEIDEKIRKVNSRIEQLRKELSS